MLEQLGALFVQHFIALGLRSRIDGLGTSERVHELAIVSDLEVLHLLRKFQRFVAQLRGRQRAELRG